MKKDYVVSVTTMSYQEVSVVRLIWVISFFFWWTRFKVINVGMVKPQTVIHLIKLSNYSDLTRSKTPKSSWGTEIPLFQGNLSWLNILLWPDSWDIPGVMKYTILGRIKHYFPTILGSDLEPQNLPKQRAVKVPRKFPSSGQWNFRSCCHRYGRLFCYSPCPTMAKVDGLTGKKPFPQDFLLLELGRGLILLV